MYQAGLNIKQGVIEASERGAAEWFGNYDMTHSRADCAHCPDMGCIPPTPADPYPPNVCDAIKCAMCFRDEEAIAYAVSGAKTGVSSLKTVSVGFEHGVWCGDISEPASRSLAKEMRDSHTVLSNGMDIPFCASVFRAELVPDPLADNGVSLSRIVFSDDVGISLYSPEFGIASVSGIPAGFEVWVE